MRPSLKVQLGKIKFKNPVITCSGTFSHGEEHMVFYDIGKLGAVTTKSYSLLPMKGNPPPRICETASGVLNSIGLQNDGIDSFIYRHLPWMKGAGASIILSIFGRTTEEFKKIALRILDIKSEILAVELNLSCPNLEQGGKAFCAVPEEVKRVVDSVVSMLDIPVIVKLSPDFETIDRSAELARQSGAEAISIINTVVGMAVDIDTAKPLLGNVTGGLSGPAVKPIALARVYQLCQQDILPVIAMGGVFGYRDLLEFLIVGARAVGIGTANFVQYDIGERILNDLTAYLREKKIDDVNKIIGRLKVEKKQA
ncbi:MAG: dihydroorotate dehydrogenase [Actinobacteria bacterium]|nr:dihydroorotate dehydrogenase [Actinomycetota bacterium]